MDAQIEVTLISPAKVDGKRQPIGRTVYVTEAVMHQLAAAQAIPALAIVDDEISPVPTKWEEDVAAKAQEIAEAVVIAAVDVAVSDLVSDLEQEKVKNTGLLDDLDALDAKLKDAEAKIVELQGTIDSATARATTDDATAPLKEQTGGKPAGKGKAKT